MPLTDAKVRNAKPTLQPAKLTDGGGLYLLIKPTGTKLWRYRYRIDGRENVYAIGQYPDISLAQARGDRDAARKLVKKGIHPAHTRKTERLRQSVESANTFQAVAKEWIGKRKSGWSSYYLRQVERGLKANIYPYIGAMPIKSVTAAHILDALQRVEARGAETVALLLRQWCSAIFRYAVSTLRADGDPAAALKGAISRSKVQHSKPLSLNEIPGMLNALEVSGGYRTTKIALQLLLLTFVRTIELRGARWTEFDLEGAEWRIPADRMKMREQHIVPLSHQAVRLLRELHTLTGGREYLFPNYRRPKAVMTATTLNRALERMGYAGRFSAHGFRATASTVLNEMGYRSDVIERQLAHKERNKVRASYNQAEYLEERRKMMQVWADLLVTTQDQDSKVVAVSFGKAV